ncbi:hypothetical protein [Cerasicoccus maritimus]|uniref:hypothetical protein n=1 Tax=Cerasicoccus maritimus TaxID=490089 RepID=UPI002852B3C9|nr:hypothetical protein [Cerasicoccus maritimus]
MKTIPAATSPRLILPVIQFEPDVDVPFDLYERLARFAQEKLNAYHSSEPNAAHYIAATAHLHQVKKELIELCRIQDKLSA